MKKKLATIAMALLFSSALATGAWAADEYGSPSDSGSTADQATTQDQMGSGQMGGESQDQAAQQEGQDMQASAQQSSVQPADKLVGKAVQSAEGQKLGKIKSVMIDTSTGQVAFVLLQSGGLAGMGGTQHLVPFNALQVSPQQDQITLAMSQEQLQQAPEGKAVASREEQEKIFQFYGVSPYWEESGQQQQQPMLQEHGAPPMGGSEGMGGSQDMGTGSQDMGDGSSQPMGGGQGQGSMGE